ENKGLLLLPYLSSPYLYIYTCKRQGSIYFIYMYVCYIFGIFGMCGINKKALYIKVCVVFIFQNSKNNIPRLGIL
ncbi:hypothetical protein B1209_27630, partial (plasmid) [Raoultella planticola]